MKEAVFLKRNAEQWKKFEQLIRETKDADPDLLADLYVRLSNDLAYSRTYFPQSNTTQYLNALVSSAHQRIYRNRKEKGSRIVTFWLYELPRVIYYSRRDLMYSLLFFVAGMLIGIVSAKQNPDFVRLILGDAYVNQTIENIRSGDPMAIYKGMHQTEAFLGITVNNIRVSFYAFAGGILFTLGTLKVLITNSIMLGAFQTFFYNYDLLWTSVLTVWIHGTLEISAIILAGGAGLTMGRSWIFPGTYLRATALKRGAKRGLKIIIGIIPLFIIAGFLEGYVTRYTGLPDSLKIFIILTSLGVVGSYFIYYPYKLIRDYG